MKPERIIEVSAGIGVAEFATISRFSFENLCCDSRGFSHAHIHIVFFNIREPKISHWIAFFLSCKKQIITINQRKAAINPLKSAPNEVSGAQQEGFSGQRKWDGHGGRHQTKVKSEIAFMTDLLTVITFLFYVEPERSAAVFFFSHVREDLINGNR